MEWTKKTGKENVVCIQKEYHSAIKESNFEFFVEKWVNLVTTVLSEMNDRHRIKYEMVYLCKKPKT